MQPVSTRKVSPAVSSFLRLDFLIPAPQTNSPGIKSAKTSFVKPPSFRRATTGPVVETVSVDDPVPPATTTAPTEQVTGSLTRGETLQVKFTVEALNAPVGVMVIADRADVPGATEAGDSADDARLNPELVMATLVPLDVLPLKLPSPPYAAVMACVPAVRVEVENAATPVPLTLELPICVVPSRKLTVPVGRPEVPGVTVAVSMTL